MLCSDEKPKYVEELSCVLLETNLKSQKLSYLIVLVSCMYFVYVTTYAFSSLDLSPPIAINLSLLLKMSEYSQI